MKFTQLFFYNNHFERNHQNFELIDLMHKSCLVHQDTSGIYSWLSLGFILKKKVEQIIHEEMNEIGFSEMELSLMQDAKLWQETGRINSYGGELFTLQNRKKQSFILGATCEELITNIVKNFYNGTQINLHIYQIGNKYRDELRAKSGLVRAKEFIMKDGYSFCSNEVELEDMYKKVKLAYTKIFERLGLKYQIVSSDNGEIGGKSSEEFHCLSEYGEAEISDKKTLEIAHIFNLGQNYSEKMGLVNNLKQHVYMGCYGIGVSRLVMALLEQHRDDLGFFGTNKFNSFDFIISVIDYKIKEHQEISLKLYNDLKSKGYNVLLDDRDIQAGKKMADSELIGVRYRIIVGKQSIAKNQYELLNRKDNSKSFYTLEQLGNI